MAGGRCLIGFDPHTTPQRIGAAWAIGLSVGLAPLAGCNRSYVAREPRVIAGRHANAMAHELSGSALVPETASVTMLVGAAAETRLKGATLATASSPLCQGTHQFQAVHEDGAFQPQGPLDITGSHSLEFYFKSGDPTRSPWAPGTAVDLELETPESAECLRVPVISTEAGSSQWMMDPTSAGILTEDGVRLFPFRVASTSSIAPAWTIFTRLGAAFGSSRLWAEFSGGNDGSRQHGDVILSAGGDRVFLETGRWAVGVGGAYDLVWNLDIHPKSSFRYFLHGPRLTPALSFLPFPLRSSNTGLPFGRRNAFIELELPLSVWFGTGEAPGVVPSAGAGLSIGAAF
jgi:hypothetical protein